MANIAAVDSLVLNKLNVTQLVTHVNFFLISQRVRLAGTCPKFSTCEASRPLEVWTILLYAFLICFNLVGLNRLFNRENINFVDFFCLVLSQPNQSVKWASMGVHPLLLMVLMISPITCWHWPVSLGALCSMIFLKCGLPWYSPGNLIILFWGVEKLELKGGGCIYQLLHACELHNLEKHQIHWTHSRSVHS